MNYFIFVFSFRLTWWHADGIFNFCGCSGNGIQSSVNSRLNVQLIAIWWNMFCTSLCEAWSLDRDKPGKNTCITFTSRHDRAVALPWLLGTKVWSVKLKYSFSSEMTAQFESVLCKWIFTILAMIADVNEFQELNIHSCEFYFWCHEFVLTLLAL